MTNSETANAELSIELDETKEQLKVQACPKQCRKLTGLREPGAAQMFVIICFSIKQSILY